MQTRAITSVWQSLALAVVFAVLSLGIGEVAGQSARSTITEIPLNSLDRLEPLNARMEVVTYRGRRAVRLIPGKNPEEESVMALVTGMEFKNGTIEADVAGIPRPGAPPAARGFVGIAFRVQSDPAHFEHLFIRPSNGRADDQLRRNHSVQYQSLPDFPWYRLRKESPGVYESYTDLETGAWTKIRIVVTGNKAQLYVGGASEPCLIVNDLKLGDTHGRIALWSQQTTDAYFSNLRITPAN